MTRQDCALLNRRVTTRLCVLQHVCVCVCARVALQRAAHSSKTFDWRSGGSFLHTAVTTVGQKFPIEFSFFSFELRRFITDAVFDRRGFTGFAVLVFTTWNAHVVSCAIRGEKKLNKNTFVPWTHVPSIVRVIYLFIFAASCRSQAAQSVRSLFGTKVLIPREVPGQYTYWASFTNRFPTILIIRMIRSQSLWAIKTANKAIK